MIWNNENDLFKKGFRYVDRKQPHMAIFNEK